MISWFLVAVAVLALAEWLSTRGALNGVDYDVTLSKKLAEIGEEVQMISVVTNRRRRFIPFIRLQESVPQGMVVEGDLRVDNATQKRCLLRSTLYMMPRQRLTRRTPFTMQSRGRFLFLGSRLNGGDFLGLSENEVWFKLERELVMLPEALPAETVQRLMGGWMGDCSVNRFIMEDPVLTLGYRDYTGREPMKRIAWAQTARQGRMTVRCQDYTVERTVTVMLNTNTFAFGAYGEAMLEACFSLCRGVCEALEERRIPYALITNACAEGMPEGFGEVGDGLGQAHLNTVLEGLGRANYKSRFTLEALFERAAERASVGRGHVLITPVRSDRHEAMLERLRLTTGETPLVLTAEEALES